jgi:hypothetical protein
LAAAGDAVAAEREEGEGDPPTRDVTNLTTSMGETWTCETVQEEGGPVDSLLTMLSERPATPEELAAEREATADFGDDDDDDGAGE